MLQATDVVVALEFHLRHLNFTHKLQNAQGEFSVQLLPGFWRSCATSQGCSRSEILPQVFRYSHHFAPSPHHLSCRCVPNPQMHTLKQPFCASLLLNPPCTLCLTPPEVQAVRAAPGLLRQKCSSFLVGVHTLNHYSLITVPVCTRFAAAGSSHARSASCKHSAAPRLAQASESTLAHAGRAPGLCF